MSQMFSHHSFHGRCWISQCLVQSRTTVPVKRTIPWKGGEVQVIAFPDRNRKLLDGGVMIRQSLCPINIEFIELCEIAPVRDSDDDLSLSRDSSWTGRERSMSGKA